MFCKIVLFLALFANFTVAQQTAVERAVEFYKQGNNQAAITALESLSKQKDTKKDAKVWNFLGLAYIETGNLKRARKALEKANSLSPQSSAIKPQAETNVTPLRILTKSRPNYTDKARQNGISGTVTLYVLFGANGKILNALPVKTLGYGLDEEAVKAARRITFEPKTENGKPVSVVKLVQYSFTIY
jgi:TonB family protein